MSNVIAINDAAKKHIAAARATSDEMLLADIAKGDRASKRRAKILLSRKYLHRAKMSGGRGATLGLIVRSIRWSRYGDPIYTVGHR